MVEDHTTNDLGHLADNAMLPDHGPLDASPFLNLCRASDHGVPGDLSFLVDERPVLGVGRKSVACLAEELYRAFRWLVIVGI